MYVRWKTNYISKNKEACEILFCIALTCTNKKPVSMNEFGDIVVYYHLQ